MDPDFVPPSVDGITPTPVPAAMTTPLKSPPPTDYNMKLVSYCIWVRSYSVYLGVVFLEQGIVRLVIIF